MQTAQKQSYILSVCSSGWAQLQPQPPRLGAQPEHRGVSCFGTKGTATAASKNITTGKAGLPKQLERLFPLDQFISERISSSYVSCLATAIVNTSHWILLRKTKGPSTDLLHGNSHYPTAWSLCGSCRNKLIFVSSTTGNKNN